MKSDDSKIMMRIVIAYLSRAEAAIFRKKVAWKTLGLDDYPKIVKNPMDLGTIKRNLEAGKYKDSNDVANDIRLVWSNCMAYNQDGSEIYHLADSFARSFEAAYRSLRNMDQSDKDPEAVPTIDERIKLTYDLFKISDLEMGRILTIIEEEQSHALSKKKNNNDDILINIDFLAQKPILFHRIADLVQASIASEGSTKATTTAITDNNYNGSAMDTTAMEIS